MLTKSQMNHLPQKRRGNRNQVKHHRYIERKKLSFVGQTQYLCLSSRIAVNQKNYHLLRSPQFGLVLRKMVEDFNILLSYEYKYFWRQITSSKSFLNSLQSCLVYLSKKSFNKIVGFGESMVNLPSDGKILQSWMVLSRLVLFLYHRIICQSQENERRIIYDEWIMDIPKMLNLIQLYKQENTLIVKQIIHTCLERIPFYKNDFTDFLWIMRDNVIPYLRNSLALCYPSKQKNRNSVDMEDTMKTLISFYDTFKNLINIYEIFPENFTLPLACFVDVQQDLLTLSQAFLDRLSEWTIQNSQVKGLLKIIGQDIIKYYEKSFTILQELIKNKPDNSLWKQGMKTYELYCEMFFDNPSKSKSFILNELYHKNIKIFFLNKSNYQDLAQKFPINKSIILKSYKFEKAQKQKQKFSLHLEKIINSIPSFQELRMKQNRRFFNYQLKEQKKKRLMLKRIQRNIDKKYDDEPEIIKKEWMVLDDKKREDSFQKYDERQSQ